MIFRKFNKEWYTYLMPIGKVGTMKSKIMGKDERIRCMNHSLTQSSSSRLGHKASVSSLHRVLSLAMCWACPHVSSLSFSSAITVRRQVVLGRPLFLFPGGVHLNATFGMRFSSILSTCPSHRKRRRLISPTILWLPVSV